MASTKLLCITEDHQAQFLRNGQWASISSLESDDVLALVREVANNSDVAFDVCTEENDIVNPIDKTIYIELYKQLNDLNENRDTYLDGVKAEFDAYEQSHL